MAPKGSGDGEVQRLGRYRVLYALGNGTSATVYAALDESSGRQVALKVLKNEAIDAETSARRQLRMVRESEALIKSAHPNVVRIFEIGRVEQRTFIAMELIDGPDLFHWLETPRSTDQILRVFLQCAEGLAAAHRGGIVHRDFKPANVMLKSDGTALVSDFGLARLETQDGSDGGALALQLTRTGAVLGTPRYMAPEQFEAGAVDARTDQFAFAIALYEALYRRHPFLRELRPDVPPVIAYSTALAQGQAVPPPIGDATPAGVWAILERALSLEAAARWPSMEHLIEALVEAIERPAKERAWFFASSALSLALVVAGIFVAASSVLGPAECRAKDVPLAELGWRGGVGEALLSRPTLHGVWEQLKTELERADRWENEARASACAARATPETKAALGCLKAERAALEKILGRGGELPPLAVAGALSALELGGCGDEPSGEAIDGAIARGSPAAIQRVLWELADSAGTGRRITPVIPAEIRPARLLGLSLVFFGFADKAAGFSLLEAAVRAPKTTDDAAAVDRAVAALVERRLDEARSKAATQDFSGAEAEVTQLLRALPDDRRDERAQAAIARGYLRLARAQHEAAETDFGLAAQVAEDPARKTKAELGSALTLLAAGEPRRALPRLRAVYEARGGAAPLERAEAGLALARALRASGEAGSKAILRRCLDDASNDRELTLLIGGLLAEDE